MDRVRALAIAAIVAAAGCSSTISLPPPEPAPSLNPAPSIQHIIVLEQENRSFDNLFAGYPGADSATSGLTHKGKTVPLTPITLETCKCLGGVDIDHGHHAFELEFDGGKLDGFDTINFGTNGFGPPAGLYPYAFVVRRETKPYWDLAHQYTLADHMFSTATTGSFIAHQEIIAGTTRLNDKESLTDYPTSIPWGCDASPGTKTAVIHTDGTVNPIGGPFPCLTQYKTMADVLDAAGVSWKFYVAPMPPAAGADFSGQVWNSFDAIKNVRYGPDWKRNVSSPNTTFFSDLKKGRLPKVSWLMPTLADSDHPASASNTGPSWVVSVVNAVGKSKYWKNTAIVVFWDDWGGFYDNVVPPQPDYTSLGFRVPMLLISPYAKPNYVDPTQYEIGSILKFIEQNFGTGSLGATDVRSNSIGAAFNFTQPAIRFRTISAPYPPSFFLGPRNFPTAQQVIEKDGFPD